MYAMSTTPRTVRQLLESTMRLYQHAFQALLPLTMIAVVAALILNGFTLTHVMPENPLDLLKMRGFTLTLISWIIFYTYAYGALWAKLDFLARGEEMTSARAFAIGLRALPTLCFATLLFLVALEVGLLLFFVPGVFVSVALCLYGPIIMLEGKGAIAGLRESHELVRGSWWYIAVAQLAGGLPVLVGVMIMLVITSLVLELAGAGDGGKLVFGLVVSALIAAAVTPFFAALVLECYYEMKIRRSVPPVRAV